MNHNKTISKEATLRKTAAVKRRCFSLSAALTTLPFLVLTAFAEGEDAGPAKVLNNFIDFLFVITRALGTAGCLFGLIQIGMGVKSHDVSQRDVGIMALIGSLIILFAKEILTMIGAV